MSSPSRVETIFFAALDQKSAEERADIWTGPAAPTPRCGAGWNGCWTPIRKRRTSWPTPPSIAMTSTIGPEAS